MHAAVRVRSIGQQRPCARAACSHREWLRVLARQSGTHTSVYPGSAGLRSLRFQESPPPLPKHGKDRSEQVFLRGRRSPPVPGAPAWATGGQAGPVTAPAKAAVLLPWSGDPPLGGPCTHLTNRPSVLTRLWTPSSELKDRDDHLDPVSRVPMLRQRPVISPQEGLDQRGVRTAWGGVGPQPSPEVHSDNRANHSSRHRQVSCDNGSLGTPRERSFLRLDQQSR